MKPYRFIAVTLVNVDKDGNTQSDMDWRIDVSRGSVTRFMLKGCEATGLDQVFKSIVNQLVRAL